MNTTVERPDERLKEGQLGKLGFEWWAVNHPSTPLPIDSICPYEGLRFTSVKSIKDLMLKHAREVKASGRFAKWSAQGIAEFNFDNHRIFRVKDCEV